MCTMHVCTTAFGNTASMAWGKPLQAIAAGDQDVLDAAVFQLADQLEPKLGALVAFETNSQHFLEAIDAHIPSAM